MNDVDRASARPAAMRRAFDASFAEAPAAPARPARDVLRVRAGGIAHTLALAQLGSLHAGTRIVPVPTPARQLLGVAAVRGAIVPIYDLAIALGADASPIAPRWIAIARGDAGGFAFDGFDGYARIEPELETIDLVELLGRMQSHRTQREHG